MSFHVINMGLDPRYARLATNEDGTTKSFKTIKAAFEEASNHKSARVVCTGLTAAPLFDYFNMIGFLCANSDLTEEDAFRRMTQFYITYKQQYEG